MKMTGEIQRALFLKAISLYRGLRGAPVGKIALCRLKDNSKNLKTKGTQRWHIPKRDMIGTEILQA